MKIFTHPLENTRQAFLIFLSIDTLLSFIFILPCLIFFHQAKIKPFKVCFFSVCFFPTFAFAGITFLDMFFEQANFLKDKDLPNNFRFLDQLVGSIKECLHFFLLFLFLSMFFGFMVYGRTLFKKSNS